MSRGKDGQRRSERTPRGEVAAAFDADQHDLRTALRRLAAHCRQRWRTFHPPLLEEIETAEAALERAGDPTLSSRNRLGVRK